MDRSGKALKTNTTSGYMAIVDGVDQVLSDDLSWTKDLLSVLVHSGRRLQIRAHPLDDDGLTWTYDPATKAWVSEKFGE